MDLGIDAAPKPIRKQPAVSKKESPPDRLVQTLFEVSYYITACGIVVGWIIAVAAAREYRHYGGLLTMVFITIAAVPTFALYEALRVGLRMLCIIAQKSDER